MSNGKGNPPCFVQVLEMCGTVNAVRCKVGKKYWKEAGVEHKIDLMIAPAVQSMEKLLADGHEGTFDFIFIDADKLLAQTWNFSLSNVPNEMSQPIGGPACCQYLQSLVLGNRRHRGLQRNPF
eukprot:5945181-Amphidinium_carterae.1